MTCPRWGSLHIVVCTGLLLVSSVHAASLGEDGRGMFPESLPLSQSEIPEPYIQEMLKDLQAYYEQKLQQQRQQAFLPQDGVSDFPQQDQQRLIEYEKLPLQMALHSRAAFVDDVTKEDMKRGSYMSLCHFKICNMGRKRSGLRWSQRLRK